MPHTNQDAPSQSKFRYLQSQLGHQHLTDIIALGKDPQLASIVQGSGL